MVSCIPLSLNILLLLIAGIFVIYLYMSRNYQYWRKRGVKQMEPSGFFGNFGECIFARKTVTSFFHELYAEGKGERVIGYYVMDKPCLMVRDPELIKHVLVKDFKYFQNRSFTVSHKDILGKLNLLSLRGDTWKFVRQKLTPIFTPGRLKNMFGMMMDVVQELDVVFESLDINETGRVIELKDICAKFATDTIGVTAFGIKFNSLNNPNAEFRKFGKDIFKHTYKRYISMLSLYFMPSLVKWMGFSLFDSEMANFFKNVFLDTMKTRDQSGIKRTDMIDVLLNIRNNQKKDQNQGKVVLDDDLLIAQAAFFFASGFETPASLASFALYELAKQPSLQNRLKKEINDALQQTNGDITYELVTSLSYLEMIISETLRLYADIAFINRIAEYDYKFPGMDLTIKKGTLISIPKSALHMDSQHFPNPELFDPERFNEINKHSVPSFAYLPFGEGPHICIGMRIGRLQSKLMLVHILSKYEVETCKDTLIPMKFDTLSLFDSSLEGIKLNVRKI